MGGVGVKRVAGLGEDRRAEVAHGSVVGVRGEEIPDALTGEREEHVVDEGDRRSGALDIEEDGAAVEDDHVAAFPPPGTQAGPRHSGS